MTDRSLMNRLEKLEAEQGARSCAIMWREQGETPKAAKERYELQHPGELAKAGPVLILSWQHTA
jgi:hypothetical protein